jgi:hypothetical protein
VHDPLLVRLTDAARLADARREEGRRRLLAGIATESATLAGTLVDLAEAGAPVSLRARGGRVHAGAVVLVGGDFTVIESGAGQFWCRFSAVAAVRVAAGSAAAMGARVGADLQLHDALALLVDDRPRLAFDLVSGEVVAGALVAVGADVITVALDGGDVLYVPSGSLEGILRSG